MKLHVRYTIYIIILISSVLSVLSGTLFLFFNYSQKEVVRYSFDSIRDDIIEQTEKRGRTITGLLANNLANPLYLYDLRTIYELLSVTVNQPDVHYVILYGPDGRIIHTGDEHLTKFGQDLNDPESVNAIQNKDSCIIHTDENILNISVPIWIGETPLGGIKVGLSLDSISSHIQSMSNQFDKIKRRTTIQTMMAVSLISLFFIILGVTTIFFLMRKLTKPIRNLTSNANKIGGGDYSHEIVEFDNSEIGELSKAFNQMRKDLILNEASLIKSEKKYRHLFNSAPAGISKIDLLTNKIIEVNEIFCTLFGYSSKELLSKDPLSLFTEGSQKQIVKQLKENIKIKKSTDKIECEVVKKDGQNAFVIICYDFIYKKNIPIAASAVVHDITDRVELEKKNIEAQKAASNQAKYALIGQVAGKMAHDFNNVLGIIMGNAELSMMTYDGELKQMFKLIFDQTIRGKNLTKNLIAFAQSQELKQHYFKINEKIELVINLLKNDLKEIEVALKDDLGELELLADPGMIEHTLTNLIQNSIHATCKVKFPKIFFRTYCSKSSIFIEVEDNGCGIPGEYLQSIFDPSFTLKGSKDTRGAYKRDIKGTGYGLANVKKYIDQHKGSILVDSTVDSGTKFTIQLPIIKRELSKKEKMEFKQVNFETKKNILLVEDEQEIADMLYKVLTQKLFNHKVDIAFSGKQAMDLYLNNNYDCVSLDYMLLGQMNGMDIYKKIREDNQIIPILFLSGNIDFIESIIELKKSDSNLEHLSKPCQHKDYLEMINKLLVKSLSKS